MVDLPEYFLAGIVFHELAHQRLYVPGDTEFNESFAVVVERAGMRRWIEAAGRAELGEHYRVAADRRAAFLDVVRDTRRDLEAAYASSRTNSEKREAKARLFERLRSRYAALRATWTSGPTYDFWFERGVNNAAIALLSTYDRWVPALEALLVRSGGDLQAFYRASDELAALSPDERRARLEAIERADRPVRLISGAVVPSAAARTRAHAAHEPIVTLEGPRHGRSQRNPCSHQGHARATRCPQGVPLTSRCAARSWKRSTGSWSCPMSGAGPRGRRRWGASARVSPGS